MKLIKEPRNVDFSIKSEPWTKEELAEFRLIMKGKKNNSDSLKSKKKIKELIKN